MTSFCIGLHPVIVCSLQLNKTYIPEVAFTEDSSEVEVNLRLVDLLLAWHDCASSDLGDKVE
jgi:hypothetical protein